MMSTAEAQPSPRNGSSRKKWFSLDAFAYKKTKKPRLERFKFSTPNEKCSDGRRRSCSSKVKVISDSKKPESDSIKPERVGSDSERVDNDAVCYTSLIYLKKWNLSGSNECDSGNNTTVRVGLVNNEPMLRISTERDLLEERPHPPNLVLDSLPEYTKHFEIKKDENGRDIVPKTVFLTLKETLGLSVLVRSCVYRARFSGLMLLSEPLIQYTQQDYELFEKDPNSIDQHSRFGFLQHYPSDIETFARASGGNQGQQMRVKTGHVEISRTEIDVLNRVLSGEIIGSLKALEKIHSNLSEAVLTEAGKCLSKMVFSKFGKFDENQVRFKNGMLTECFMLSYSEFMGMGYTSALLETLYAETEKYKVNFGWFDSMRMINHVLSQINVLYNEKYIKCPS